MLSHWISCGGNADKVSYKCKRQLESRWSKIALVSFSRPGTDPGLVSWVTGGIYPSAAGSARVGSKPPKPGSINSCRDCLLVVYYSLKSEVGSLKAQTDRYVWVESDYAGLYCAPNPRVAGDHTHTPENLWSCTATLRRASEGRKLQMLRQTITNDGGFCTTAWAAETFI